MSMNGNSYTYGDASHKHAVTQVASTGYAYDANGNMTTRGSQTITWDIENRPTSVTGGVSFVYDGDGNRVKKTEGGQTSLYINKYYEKNLSTSVETLNYYLGDKLIAIREGTTLRYVHQDSLSGTSVMSDTNGGSLGSISYFPFGSTRSGAVPTDKKFTGQRLDTTGLYFYNARYYDPGIGRFISADTMVPDPLNSQEFNRYTYALNNPLRYVDPTGHDSGEGLETPAEDGQLGWTKKDGWLIGKGGKWIPIVSPNPKPRKSFLGGLWDAFFLVPKSVEYVLG